jgi:glycosyltransferase involved in cell wall biosynthesis
MRIAIATDIYLPQLSGIADSIDTLAGELIKAGHEVRIYAPRVRGAASAPHVRRLPAFAVPGSGGGLQLVLPLGLTRDLRKFSPDVIHVHMFAAVGWAGVRAGRRLAIPVVGTDHTFPADYLHYLRLDYHWLKTFVRKFAARFYNRCRVVTAPSRSMIEELQAHGLTAPTTVVSNPIRTDLFRPLDRRGEIKRRLGIGPEAVLLFGRVAAEKNLELAVDIFAGVAERRHAELVVIGDGPYRGALEQRLAERKLGSRTRILGELRGEALNEAINACDLYLITSKSETQSMTLLQASAAGLPVVAIRAGALPEYVADGQTGYLVDESDRDRFVELIVSLLDDRGFARRLGAKGREFAQKFGPPAMAAAFTAVYAEAIAGGRAAERLPAPADAATAPSGEATRRSTSV